jgi:hypothetical protein
MRLTAYETRTGEIIDTAYAVDPRSPRDLDEAFGCHDPKELRNVLRLLRDNGWLVQEDANHLTAKVRVEGEKFPARRYTVRDVTTPGDIRSVCRKLRYDARHEGRPRRMRAFTF